MNQVSHACLCCAIKLINNGEHPYRKKKKKGERGKTEIKENLIIMSGTAVTCFTFGVTNGPWVGTCQVPPQKWLPLDEVMSLLLLLGTGFIKKVELH